MHVSWASGGSRSSGLVARASSRPFPCRPMPTPPSTRAPSLPSSRTPHSAVSMLFMQRGGAQPREPGSAAGSVGTPAARFSSGWLASVLGAGPPSPLLPHHSHTPGGLGSCPSFPAAYPAAARARRDSSTLTTQLTRCSIVRRRLACGLTAVRLTPLRGRGRERAPAARTGGAALRAAPRRGRGRARDERRHVRAARAAVREGGPLWTTRPGAAYRARALGARERARPAGDAAGPRVGSQSTSPPPNEGAMSSYRKTKTPGVYVSHEQHCPRANGDDRSRCRCMPSFRGRRRHPVTKRPGWSPSMKDRAAVLTWLNAAAKGGEAVQEAVAAGPTFRKLGRLWLEGVENGSIGKRRGKKGSAYSETTLAGYKRSLINQLDEEFGPRPAAEIVEVEWQMWADRLAREGISRSRIRNHLAVASAIYGWAARPTRRLVDRNPTLAVELPPNDEQPRMRVCTAEEAAHLLAALEPDDQLPYALGFYAGLRRAEISRLDWRDVDLGGFRLQVRKSKAEAGPARRPPIAQTLRPKLREAWVRQGQPSNGPVSAVSVMSGKLAIRATKAWKDRPSALERITLHECRHTYASFLMAANYTVKEIMDYMGHSNLAMVQRYVKLLPRPEETDPAERLNAYLARRAAS